tara:strand:- start:316 stop:570 length:255 start_codon:yes stop_codon:yes gene_type:complete
MKINKKLVERTIYIILIANVFITIFVSSLILSFRGSENNLIFFFENDPEFVVAVFLAFVVFYPFLFLVTYLITFIIQLLMRKLL